MNKLSVRAILAESYTFTFGHLGKVIALIWLPVVALTIGRYFAVTRLLASMATGEDDIAARGQLAVQSLGFNLAFFVLSAMAIVAITREIIQPRGGPAFLRVRLGGEELRTIGGVIGLFLILMVVSIAAVLATYILAMIIGVVAGFVAPAAMSRAIPNISNSPKVMCDPAVFALVLKLAAGFVIAIGAAVAYFGLRLGFLLVPAAVMEDKFGLASSWQLTKGNFWRIAAITVASYAPILLLGVIIDLVVQGPRVFDLHLTEYFCDQTAYERLVLQDMQATAAHMPLAMGLSFLFAPITYALAVAPAAFVYRALKGEKAG
jgi:hypothetical protein